MEPLDMILTFAGGATAAKLVEMLAAAVRGRATAREKRARETDVLERRADVWRLDALKARGLALLAGVPEEKLGPLPDDGLPT